MTVPFIARIRNRVIWEIARLAKPKEIVIAGKRMRLNYNTYHSHVLRGLINGWHEACEVETLTLLADSGLIGPSMRVMDIGAGLGLMTMVIADLVGDDNVIGYEANPDTAAECRRNISLNRHNFEVRNVAVIAQDEPTVTFHVKGALCGSSLLNVEGTVDRITVPAVNFVRELDIVRPDILSMDIEGAEIEVLSNCSDFGPVHLMIIELHPQLVGKSAVDGLLAHLSSCGFERQAGVHNHVAILTREGTSCG